MGSSNARQNGSMTQTASDAPGGPAVRSKTTSAASKLISADDVISKKGTIAVNSRYISDRPMSDFYHLEPKVVGSGMSGQVYLATNIKDQSKSAVKSFKKKGLAQRKRNELKSEVEIYLALDHPHIARLEKVFETDDELYLVMEFMAGGELYDRLSAKKQYTEEAAATTTYQMLLAVAYLHAHQIAHRDLKLENFLYEAKDTDHLKLIDFGFAKFREHDTKMSQACGSVHYVAPEVLAHSYTERADLWSLGVIVYMLLTGSPPFHGPDDEVLKKIKAGKPHWSSRFNRLSEPSKRFVKELLVVSPEKRMPAEKALQHEWITTKHTLKEAVLDQSIVTSLRNYAHASSFRRAVLSMMAWSLSTDERKELRDLFLTIDVENRGTITHSELKNILEENFHISSREVEKLFQNLDTDNDQEIAYTEFLAAALQGRVKVHESLLRSTFQRFDSDQGGKISAEELKGILGNQFEGHEVEELIREADINHDGEVDYEEFIAYFNRPVPVQEDEGDEADAESHPDGSPDGAKSKPMGDEPTTGTSKKKASPQQAEKLAALVDTLVAGKEEDDSKTGPRASAHTSTPLRRLSANALIIGGV